MPPERWQKMSTAKKQKAIRVLTLNKIAGLMHVPQNTLRENYLDTFSLLVEYDPATYARELMFDADQLNFFLNEKARSQEIIKSLSQEVKGVKEPEKKSPKKEKTEKPEVPVKKEPDEPTTTLEKKSPSRSQSTLFDGF
jgi:replication factor C large subunit